jgi:hypothetical protein
MSSTESAGDHDVAAPAADSDHARAVAADRPAAVERARGPRADLRAALLALETAAARPAPNRLGSWAMQVHDALVDLNAAFERHIAVTEGPEGLLEEIRRAAPPA